MNNTIMKPLLAIWYTKLLKASLENSFLELLRKRTNRIFRLADWV